MFEPKDLFLFLKKPVYIIHPQKENVLLTAIKTYLLFLLFVGLFYSIFYSVLSKIIDLPVDRAKQIPHFFENRRILFFFYFSMLMPMAEELLFRLPLKFSIRNLLVANSLLILSICLNLKIGFLVIFLIEAAYITILFLLLRKYYEDIGKFWRKNFPLIFYFLSIAFGLVHLTNFEVNSPQQVLIIFLMIVPQLLMGIFLSFLRMYYKNGILITILFHVFLNSVAFFIIFR